MSASAMMRSITEERANEYQMHQRSPLLGSRSPIAARTIGSPRLPTVRTRQRTHSAPPPYSPRCPSAKWPFFLAAGAACLVYGLSLLVQRHRPSSGNSLNTPKLSCNPFEQKGRLIVDEMEVSENRWVPFNSACGPSTLVNDLRSGIDNSTPVDLPFLHNKTVVLIGDSTERVQLDQFCSIAGGSLATISPSHPLASANYTDLLPFEEAGNQHPTEAIEDEIFPHICYLEQYNFVMISLYTYGLSTPEEFARGQLYDSSSYQAPAATVDRIQYQLLPLLDKLGREPDLIEFSSLYSDLKHYSQSDKQHHAGMESAAWAPLSQTRLGKYQEALSENFLTLAEIFPDTKRMLWRAAHLPRETWEVPYERVVAMEAAAEYVAEKLRKGQESGKTWKKWVQSFGRHFKKKVVDEEAELEALLAEKIGINPVGKLLAGMQHHFTDDLHPGIMSGGLLWSNIILRELQTLA